MCQRHLLAARSRKHVPDPRAHLRVEFQENLAVPERRRRDLGGAGRTRRRPSGKTQRTGCNAGPGGYFEESTSAGAWLLHRFPGPLKSKAFEIFKASPAPKYLSFIFISNDL